MKMKNPRRFLSDRRVCTVHSSVVHRPNFSPLRQSAGMLVRIICGLLFLLSAPSLYPAKQTDAQSSPALQELSHPTVTVLVIPGISGDLAKRKLIPALYALTRTGIINEYCTIIGIGRRDSSVARLLDESRRAFIPDYAEKTGKKLLSRMHYVRCDIENSADAVSLRKMIEREEKRMCERLDPRRRGDDGQGPAVARALWRTGPPSKSLPAVAEEALAGMQRDGAIMRTSKSAGDKIANGKNMPAREQKIATQRVIYCALPSASFCLFTRDAIAAGIIVPHNEHHRIAYEKPFGSDYASARALADCLKKELDADQIFLIDHYRANKAAALLPEIVDANTMLKYVWNGRHIRSVSLIFAESIGIEDRGAFYEQFGAAKDVLQNHVLQLLAGAFAETAEDFRRPHPQVPHAQADFIKASRARAAFIRSIEVDECILGQYDGYRKEKHVDPHSRTDTFVTARLTVDMPQWRSVPFFVRTGKKLAEKRTALIVDFAVPSPRLDARPTKATLAEFLSGAVEADTCARLIVTYAPHPEITLYLATHPSCASAPIVLKTARLYPKIDEPYTVLLEHILRGDHALDVGLDEIQAQWKVIEQIHVLKPPLLSYKPGSHGPAIDGTKIK